MIPGRTGVGLVALLLAFLAGAEATADGAGLASVTALAAGPASAAGEVSRGSAATRDTVPQTVVLLHGLGRTERSMRPMEERLEREGYRVVNLGYPSREFPISLLVDTLRAELAACCPREDGPLHFVTHSLGGILVRAYAASEAEGRVGRVVMLSPPNRGSQLVDRLPDDLLELVFGPAILQLGTGEGSVPPRLPEPRFELGVIAGEASLNPLFSHWLPGEDDGKVSVESARIEGAEDFLVVPYTHTFIMRRHQVIDEVVRFLGTGSFSEEAEEDVQP